MPSTCRLSSASRYCERFGCAGCGAKAALQRMFIVMNEDALRPAAPAPTHGHPICGTSISGHMPVDGHRWEEAPSDFFAVLETRESPVVLAAKVDGYSRFITERPCGARGRGRSIAHSALPR
jgi:hypothetical protein